MNLIRTSILTAFSTIIKLMIGIVSSKIIAIYIGPAGMAITGNFSNFLSITSTIASGATNGGIVKYVAEYHNNDQKKTGIINTALFIAAFCSVIISIPIFFFSEFLSSYFLKNITYAGIFKIYALTLIMFAFNGTLLAIINGHKDIKRYTVANITTSVTGFAFTALLIIFFQLYGALMAMAIAQSILLLITLFFFVNSKWYSRSFLKLRADKISVKKLSKFSLMSLTTIMTGPIAQLTLRNHIINNYSAKVAGYWESVTKISAIYLMVITTSLITYYLPRLSEIQDKNELRKEIFQGYKFLVPLTILLSATIFVSRDLIIKILFTPEFLPVREFFTFQLIGDVFKIASFILSYLIFAKAMGKLFIVSEIFFTLTYVGLSFFFMHNFGAIGITYGYALNYLFYLIFMLIAFRKLLFTKEIFS